MTAFRLLAQANNAVPAATVTASSVLPATRNVFPLPSTRTGNGQVTLSGGYVGAEDAKIELEITGASGTVSVSQPVFAGAGNGTMTDLSADPSAGEQTIAVTLADLGTTTTAAEAVLWGAIRLRAKTPGATGNTIQLTVTPALTLSAQPVGALSSVLRKETEEWTDAQHDFGAVALLPDGTIPATAPRLAFGRDLGQVYRHYKRWDGRQWRYGVSPQLAADYATHSPVHRVTGDYAVTVTDGNATETYPGLVTLYDLLTALAASALVEVVGVIANDRKPGGIAAIDLPLRTTPRVLPVIASAPERMLPLRESKATDQVATETISVTCTANTPIGAETWAVRSSALGALPDAVTGVRYDGPVQFTVPVMARDPSSSPINGSIAITNRSFPRPTDDKIGIPAICLYNPKLGAKASNKTLKLIWSARPPSECDCTDGKVSGGPSPACLGIEITGDRDPAMATLIADYQSRLVLLYQKRRDFIVANTSLDAQGELRSAALDIQLMEAAATLFAQCLADLFDDSDTPTTAALTAWDTALTDLSADLTGIATLGTPIPPTLARIAPNTAYSVGDVSIFYTSAGQGFYRCIAAGTTGQGQADGLGVELGTTSWEQITKAEAMTAATSEDINASPAAGGGFAYDIETFVQRYASQMDHIRTLAGLVPKSDASRAGGACWRDPGDAYYWEIDGEGYLPVFNNVYYHSAVIGEDGKPVSTYEFGFALRVGCPDRQKLGDTITIRVGVGDGVTADYPYQINDRYDIPTLAGGPLALAGGITGTDTLTWRVESSAQGPLPDYPLTLAELAYSGGDLGFTIHRGAIPFALGDQFRASVEPGRLFRWRKDGGSWSADTAIAASVLLTDGLVAGFISGVAPSFAASDAYHFSVLQPHSPSHVQSAHGESWQWSGSGATLTVTWQTDQIITMLGLLRHTLTSGAVAVVRVLDAADAVLYEWTPLIRPGPLLEALATPLNARKLTLALTGAPSQALGWLYAGLPFTTRHQPGITLRRHWAMERGSERNPRSAYLGRGTSGEVRWEDWLMQSEWDTLLGLIDACKTDGDAPLVLLPNVEIPDEAALVRIDQDALDLTDLFDFQPNPNERRLLSFTLPLTAVLT